MVLCRRGAGQIFNLCQRHLVRPDHSSSKQFLIAFCYQVALPRPISQRKRYWLATRQKQTEADRGTAPYGHVVQDHHRTGIFEGGTVQSGNDGRDAGVSAARDERRGEESALAGAHLRSFLEPRFYS